MRRILLSRILAWFRDSPPREAGPSALPEGLRVYAVGDIHGHADLLDRMADRIARDLKRDPPAEARAVFLGDYVDRGPDSAGVIERLAGARFPLPFVALRGNHEDLMMRAVLDPDPSPKVLDHWCRSGGIETLRSYGIEVGRAAHGKALARARAAFLERVPATHRAFLDGTALSLSLGGYFFVHAGARPGVGLDRQAAEDLMWIREACYASDYDFGKTLVHGHTPHKRPEDLPRRINVDTGAFKWGVLTAVALEGDTRRFLSTRD